MQFQYRIQRFIIRTLTRSYFGIRVNGLEHIPSSGPIIIAANHCSFLDPPIIGLGIPRQITYLAKEELFAIPILGWWLRLVGSYPVARGRGDVRVLKTALRLLKEGKTLLIFPEGTRSADGIVQPLESGFAWLAIKANVPVIPLYTADTYRLMPRQARFPKPGVIRLEVGEPILPESEDAGDSHERIERFAQRVESVLKKMESEWKGAANGKEKFRYPAAEA